MVCSDEGVSPMKQMLAAAASTTMKHFIVAIDLWHYNHVSHDQVLPFLN